MQVLKTISELSTHLGKHSALPGCLADTGFLYALAYDDDRLYAKALEVFDELVEHEIPIYANVISRMEFIDLIFRKQVTLGAIQLLGSARDSATHKNLFNLLKNIRDQDTAHRNQSMSYKIGEDRLKKLRAEMESSTGEMSWRQFCQTYVGQMLLNEWTMLEEELGINFVEIMEGQISHLFDRPLIWSDMVQIMGVQGLRGPDAMIVNLFEKSKFPLLVTSDSDLVNAFEENVPKTVFLL